MATQGSAIVPATPYVLQPTSAHNTIPTLPPSPTPALTQTALPGSTATGVLLNPVAASQPGTVIVGRSVEGLVISGRRFGSGSRVLLLVGGIHGGWEANTVDLMNGLIDHFAATPGDVLPGLSLLLIPVANPDGMPYIRGEQGRFNAHGVDLNRNWACGWSSTAYWRDQLVDAGPAPMSEPETRALAAFIENLRPEAVLFYHSVAGGVFAGHCNGDHGSDALAALVGQAAGYTYGQSFSAYPVTGTAPSWVDGLGIPAADVELSSWTEPEYERNLAAIMAVQRWLLAN